MKNTIRTALITVVKNTG